MTVATALPAIESEFTPAPQLARKGGVAAAPSRRRVPAIDGLRGIAILSVILFHSVAATSATGTRSLDRLFDVSLIVIQPVAIDLFFAISGYLITSILDGTRGADHPLRTFYFRRALRIIPLYYGILLVAVLFLRSLPQVLAGKPGAIVWQFGFMTNFALDFGGRNAVGTLFTHFWTLAIEEQFYLLWPLLMLLQPGRRNLRTCFASLILSVVTRTVLSFDAVLHLFAFPFSWRDEIFPVFIFTPAHLDGLATGAIAALLQRRNPVLLKTMARKCVVAAPVGVVITLAIVRYLTSGTELKQAVWLSAMPLLAAVFFASLIALLAMGGPTAAPRWMTWPPLTSVARYSYGMYAFHMPVILLLLYFHFVRQHVAIRGYELPYSLYFFVVIASISYGLGFLSWHLYEKHFLKLAPRYRYTAEPKLGARA